MPEADSRCTSRFLISPPPPPPSPPQPPPIYLKHVGVYVIRWSCASIPAEQPSFRPGHAAWTQVQFVSAAARATVVSSTADFLLHLLRNGATAGCAILGSWVWQAARRAMRSVPDSDCLPSPGLNDRLGYKRGASRRRGCSRVRTTRRDRWGGGVGTNKTEITK